MKFLIRFTFSAVLALAAIGSVQATGLSYMTFGPSNRSDRVMNAKEGQIAGKVGMPMHDICITSPIKFQIQVKRVGLPWWESVQTSSYYSETRDYFVCSISGNPRAMEAIAINPVRNDVYTLQYQVYSSGKWLPVVQNGVIAGLPGRGYPLEMIAISSYEGR